ncbi:alpha-hydroxy acid oxidase [Streptomyces sp. NPDC003011]
MTALTVGEYEALARGNIAANVWGFLQGGSGSESTLRANRDALDRIRLRPRFLVDVSSCDVTTALLGSPLAMPVGIAPTAYHRLVHTDGEVATARAAGEAGALMIVSMFASRTLEDIAAAATGPLWLQLYWLRRREILVELALRARDCGYRALVLTVDAPRVGRRLRDVRSGFSLPPHVRAVNVDPSVMASSHRPGMDVSAVEAHSREQFDPSITWADLAWLRERSPLPIILKGILTAEDARLAVEHGMEAVIVSNHGGRQLDGAIASIDALPEVAQAVGGHVPVLVDGAVRRGTDILKALARGADAVLIGRPALWGLAYSGADGVAAVLQLLRQELDDAMALSGCRDLSRVGGALVTGGRGPGAFTPTPDEHPHTSAG